MAMLTLLHTGNEMEAVQCFVLRIVKIDSVGCIDLLADTVRTCVVVVRYIFLATVLHPWNSSHFSNVLQ